VRQRNTAVVDVFGTDDMSMQKQQADIEIHGSGSWIGAEIAAFVE
jgi:hypothetical protein